MLFALVALTACARAGFDPAAEGLWYRISAEATALPVGEAVRLELELGNAGRGAAELVDGHLRFSQDGADLSADVEVRGQGLSGQALAPGARATAALTATLARELPRGRVEVDAVLLARNASGLLVPLARRGPVPSLSVGALQADGGAVDSASPTDAGGEDGGPVPALRVVVTVADDEDDNAGRPTVEAAGGAGDVSLREALRIAASATAAHLVTFDPAVFPPGSPRSIALDPALGPLPPISRDGTHLDARGAGVIVVGADLAEGQGLLVRASDVRVRELRLQDFVSGSDPYCLRLERGDRLRLEGCETLGCGDVDDGPGVDLQRGIGHMVADLRATGAGGAALGLGAATSGARVVRPSGTLGLELSGSGHEIEDAVIQSDRPAVFAEALRDTSLRRCQLAATNLSGHDAFSSGVYVAGGSLDLRLESCQISSVTGHALYVQGSNDRVDLRRSDVSTTGHDPIWLSPTSNPGVAPPLIERFDGLVVEGSSGAEGGVVEVFTPGDAWRYLAEGAVQAGRWQVRLPEPQQEVAVKVSSAAGATSVLSAPVPQTQDSVLVVTTAADEHDGGDAITHPDQAGGAADLSLREALVIANTRPGADTIRFDPAVFPPGEETLIRAGEGAAGEEPLPALSDDATTLDGSDSGVVLLAGRPLASQAALLRVAALGVVLRGLSLRSDDAVAAPLVRVDAGGLQLERSRLACGAAGTLGIDANRCQQCTVIDNHITGCGVKLTVGGQNVVAGNRFESVRAACVTLDRDSQSTVVDNLLENCGSHGVWVVWGSEDAVVVGNRIRGAAGAGVAVSNGGSNNLFAFNTVLGCARGMQITGNIDARVVNNLIAHSAVAGLDVRADVTWSESHNLFFDNGGDGASGANAVTGTGAAPLDPSDVLADPELPLDTVDFAPGAAAVDRGLDLSLDRNGERPGLFNGAAPDIGAVETP